MSINRGHRAGQCAPEVPRTGIRARGDLLELRPWPSSSLIQHPTPAHPARQQPHLAEIRRWRRQSGQMGQQICVCLSTGNSVNRHFQRSRELFRTDRGRPCPREWEDPQAKRGGGMERSGSLCGRVAAPRETLHGRQCGSIGKKPRAAQEQSTIGKNLLLARNRSRLPLPLAERRLLALGQGFGLQGLLLLLLLVFVGRCIRIRRNLCRGLC